MPSDPDNTAERWQRIESLFNAALEQPADDRAAFLAEACGDDTSLRREVEQLLGADDRPRDFLREPAAVVDTVRSSGDWPDLPDPKATEGTRIGAYRHHRLSPTPKSASPPGHRMMPSLLPISPTGTWSTKQRLCHRRRHFGPNIWPAVAMPMPPAAPPSRRSVPVCHGRRTI